jgi:hypothetical protein
MLGTYGLVTKKTLKNLLVQCSFKLRVTDCCNCLMRLSSKIQRHFGPLVAPFGNGEVHDVVVHQNALLSDVIATEISISYQLFFTYRIVLELRIIRSL